MPVPRRVVLAGGGTGGHLMPALALAHALRELDETLEPVLVGAQRGIEATLLPRWPFRYHLLPAEPLYRRAPWRNLRWPVLAIRLWRRCGQVLDVERPALVVGTGGYAAGPIVLRAHLRNAPIVLQEQNAFPGITTRWLARCAREVHIGFPEAREHLRVRRGARIVDSGTPIVPPPDPLPDRRASREVLRIPPDYPVVLLIGGSQGAAALNRVLADVIEGGGFRDVVLLWSTGHGEWTRYAPLDAPPMRQVRPFWDPIAEAYLAADLVVARAGAVTTAELCAWGLPALLVPLPAAAADHQARNAVALAAAGAAVHVPEDRLTPSRLRDEVSALLADPARRAAMARAARARGRPDAARRIARDLRSLIGGPELS